VGQKIKHWTVLETELRHDAHPEMRAGYLIDHCGCSISLGCLHCRPELLDLQRFLRQMSELMGLLRNLTGLDDPGEAVLSLKEKQDQALAGSEFFMRRVEALNADTQRLLSEMSLLREEVRGLHAERVSLLSLLSRVSERGNP